jgi:hypothetical protein
MLATRGALKHAWQESAIPTQVYVAACATQTSLASAKSLTVAVVIVICIRRHDADRSW